MKSQAELESALSVLADRDSLIARVRAQTGAVTMHERVTGFRGLARTIVGQQLSTASAGAIWLRLSSFLNEFTPAEVLAAEPDKLRSLGLSGSKVRSLRAVSEAAQTGFDFVSLESLPSEEAAARLVTLKGVGPWTADVYLMFCAGHPDRFAPGDLALRKAVTHALGAASLIEIDALGSLSARWRPFRTAAAFLFWAYFRQISGRSGIVS